MFRSGERTTGHKGTSSQITKEDNGESKRRRQQQNRRERLQGRLIRGLQQIKERDQSTVSGKENCNVAVQSDSQSFVTEGEMNISPFMDLSQIG